MLTNSSNGVAYADIMLFKVRSLRLAEMSARRPIPNVTAEMVRAMMVKNWYEPPKPSWRGLLMFGSQRKDAAKDHSPVRCTTVERTLHDGAGVC